MGAGEWDGPASDVEVEVRVGAAGEDGIKRVGPGEGEGGHPTTGAAPGGSRREARVRKALVEGEGS